MLPKKKCPLLENVKFSCIMFLCNWVTKIEVPEFDIITIMLGMPELLMEKKENSESQFFGDAWNSYFVDMRSLANATRKPLQVNDNIGDIYSMKRSNSGFNWLYGFGRKINFSTESAQTKSWWVLGGFWVSILRIQHFETNKSNIISKNHLQQKIQQTSPM